MIKTYPVRASVVSVIIPNYNHAQFLQKRIESVLSQTYQNIELIILDDSSSDQSREIITLFKDDVRVVHVSFNEKNSGSTFKQWKKGLEISNGEWIWIAESDDYCHNTFLESLINQRDIDNCGLRFCASVSVNINNERKTSEEQPLSIKEKQTGVEFLENHLLQGNCISNASSVLIRKDILIKALQLDVLNYKLLGDWLVWIRACCETDVYFLNKTLNFHRYHIQTVRYRLKKAGSYDDEFTVFRRAINRHFTLSKLERKGILIKKNNLVRSNEVGFLGCKLIQERRFLKGILLVLKATVNSNFNFYYLKSGIYWLLRS